MRIRIISLCSISAFFVAVCLAISTGCARKTQALFTKAELITCGRLAVLGLTPEQEQIFMASYTRAFPGQIITFVERSRLQEIISEQDLLQGRLDDRTRAKVKQILGVEAIIMCTYYDGTIGAGRKKLRVRIVNSATGAIVGSVITQARDDFEYHCDTAVKALKADLMSGSQYGYLDR
ncbi:MAG: CsgG/HfaB family protein [Sedimentisphaerales bacterium]